ncbi:histidine phosphatase family protein [Cellulomonas sp. RIT-PI-Y]|uniref:histidine phosphatase family protein n=1 Tax=Cellulomonas sp. RIT-PI-Y TaxID=3035297 RepID=UPI0021DA2182|nr:histidine phosphatase family protein [Cellulomonas sp. RIT-PI-Y]
MQLHLIRHGQTPSNLTHALDTAAPGAPLTAEGERQAAAVGRVFAGRPLQAVYASHLTRAQQTAAEVAAPHGLEVLTRHDLREILAGDLEMRTDEPSVERYLGTMVAWAAGDLDRVMPGGESGHDTLARYDRVVAEVVATGVREAALVSHGAIIRFWAVLRGTNLDPTSAADRWLDNTGVVSLVGEPGDWQVTQWQDEVVAHRSATPGDGPGGQPLPA